MLNEHGALLINEFVWTDIDVCFQFEKVQLQLMYSHLNMLEQFNLFLLFHIPRAHVF